MHFEYSSLPTKEYVIEDISHNVLLMATIATHCVPSDSIYVHTDTLDTRTSMLRRREGAWSHKLDLFTMS